MVLSVRGLMNKYVHVCFGYICIIHLYFPLLKDTFVLLRHRKASNVILFSFVGLKNGCLDDIRLL